MAGHSFTHSGYRVFIDYADAYGTVIVNGRRWRFEFHDRLGPLWLRADGEPRKCQNPNRRVWAAFQKWIDARKSPAVIDPNCTLEIMIA